MKIRKYLPVSYHEISTHPSIIPQGTSGSTTNWGEPKFILWSHSLLMTQNHFDPTRRLALRNISILTGNFRHVTSARHICLCRIQAYSRPKRPLNLKSTPDLRSRVGHHHHQIGSEPRTSACFLTISTGISSQPQFRFVEITRMTSYYLLLINHVDLFTVSIYIWLNIFFKTLETKPTKHFRWSCCASTGHTEYSQTARLLYIHMRNICTW